MSPVRLTTGRAVNPLRRPMIATVRDLDVKPLPLKRFPDPGSLMLKEGANSIRCEAVVEGVEIVGLDVEALEDVRIDRLPSSLAPPAEVGSTLDGSMSMLFSPSPGKDGVGPEELPRAYRPKWHSGEWKAETEPSPLDLLRPVLSPAIHLLDGPALDLPRPLGDYQFEAVQALIQRRSLLLADDLGTGKRMSVCLALRDLFKRVELRRGLILTSEGNLRLWTSTLARLAPELLVTVVRGDRAQRRTDWRTEAHLYISAYGTLQRDIERGALAEETRPFDVLVLDSMHAVLKWKVQPLAPLTLLEAGYRWGLAGGPPRNLQEWETIFGVLAPEKLAAIETRNAAHLESAFSPNLLRRAKPELAGKLPTSDRYQLWLDLDSAQMDVYKSALAAERHELATRGDAVTQEDIAASVERLTHTMNFPSDLFDSVKVRSLIDCVEEIAAGGRKLVVFSQFGRRTFSKLLPALRGHSVLRLDASGSESDRRAMLASFRSDPEARVLLADLGDGFDGQPLTQADYVVHFDVGWNPAHRLRAEKRLYPHGPTKIPPTFYEYRLAATIDEKIYRVLAERNLLTGDVPPWADPVELSERLSVKDWLEEVFEITRVRRPRKAAPGAQSGTTGLLPGTSMLRSILTTLEPDRLIEGVELFMKALGFHRTQVRAEPDERGGDLVAFRKEGGIEEAVLVRCISQEKAIGVGEGRSLLKVLDADPELLGAYLVSTTEFTSACRKLADESDGRLALVSGTELYRHLHILGWF